VLFSPSRKLLFVHIQRTGGTSLNALIKRSIADTRCVGRLEHGTLLEARGILGPQRFTQAYRFGFVRNPWERMVSLYTHAQQHGIVIRSTLNVSQTTTFRDFLRRQHWYVDHPQLWWLCDERGNMLASDVFRFESYRAGVSVICQRFGLSIAALPHAQSSEHAHYTTYYDAETRAIVADRYRDDIEYFGYRFRE